LVGRAGRHGLTAARAWCALIFHVGIEKGEDTRAIRLVPLASAAVARLGGNADPIVALGDPSIRPLKRGRPYGSADVVTGIFSP